MFKARQRSWSWMMKSISARLWRRSWQLKGMRCIQQPLPKRAWLNSVSTYFTLSFPDMRMGGGSGMDLLRSIRTDCPRNGNNSSHGLWERRERCRSDEAQHDYLSKPVDRRRLSTADWQSPRKANGWPRKTAGPPRQPLERQRGVFRYHRKQQPYTSGSLRSSQR